jgi:hypothetical protein
VKELTNQVDNIETNQPQWYAGSIAPIVFSIFGVIAWLVFILFYALYWSRGLSLFQNVIVTIVSLAIVGLLIGLMWVVWGTRHFRAAKRWQGGVWSMNMQVGPSKQGVDESKVEILDFAWKSLQSWRNGL